MDAMHSVLAALARYTDAERLYAFELDGLAAGTLTVERWHGWESLSAGFEWQVDLLSTDAQLPLDELLGKRATLLTRSADGERTPRSGLVREAECVGADGGLARYRLTLVPWTWLLGQGRHSRVFQDKTVIEVVEAVFADYAPLATWQVGDEVGPFLAQARPRSYVCQYKESDEAFVQRLLAEEGLGWRLQESADAPGGHTMVLFANSDQGLQDATAEAGLGIRFHRSDATESSDAIQALGTVYGIQSTTLTLLSHDYKNQTLSASLPLGEATDSAAMLEVYDPSGAYAFADQMEASRYAELIGEARTAQATQWLGQSSVRSFRAGQWFAVTDAPADGETPPEELLLVAVHQAGINNLPDTVRDSVARLFGDASNSADTTMLPPAGLPRTTWAAVQARAAAVGYGNAFTAVPRALPWRPVLSDETGARLNPHPTAPGYQSAIVVGADGSTSGELSSDALGRIKVRFHWQHDAGGASATHSCWLRMSQRYAGPGVGSQFLPRIGQEVLVGFVEGDIDRPVIVGSLYNGQGEAGIAATPGGAPAQGQGGNDLYTQAGDHRPSAQANSTGGNAPAWHGMSGNEAGHRNPAALSGFKSKEFGGQGHNRLVFDDSDGQLRLQLATTHGATELNLGHLIHQADNYRGSFRGEGFELRTDQWGAIRGQRGLWISAYGNDPEAPAGEQLAATALLQQAAQLGQAFSDIAGIHLTVKLAAHQGETKPNQSRLIDAQSPLQALLTSAKTVVDGSAYPAGEADAPNRKPTAGKDRVPHSGDAIVGLTAPAGIGLVAGQSLHWSAGETLTIASGQASNAAIAGDLRVHAGQAIGWLAGAVESKAPTAAHSLAIVSAEAELVLQAQHDSAKLQARDELKLISANAELELAAGKTVHLATEGGASITIEGGNISVTCPGNIKVHAGKKSFVGPVDRAYPLPEFPGSVCVECLLKAQAQGAPLAAKNG